jgi:hypothetical protein
MGKLDVSLLAPDPTPAGADRRAQGSRRPSGGVATRPALKAADRPATARRHLPRPDRSDSVIPEKKSAGLVAVLPFFYAGLGQIYNGDSPQGLMMTFVPPLGVATRCLFGYPDVPLVSSRARPG